MTTTLGPIVPPIAARGGNVTPISGGVPRGSQVMTPGELTFEDRHTLRDILMPVIREGGAQTFEVDQMVGFNGTHRVFRATSSDDGQLKSWAMNLAREAMNQLDKTASDWEDDKEEAFNFRVQTDVGDFRCQMDSTVTGRHLFMRRIQDHMPLISQIRMPQSFKQILLSHRHTEGGLILFTGGNGQGKTTVASVTGTARLHEHSGYMVTIENPAELPMHGFHGAGYCVQTELAASDNARQAEAFTDAMARARRKFPALTGGGR